MSNEYNVPVISVIVPAYNAEKYIEIAIQSVIDQTFEDWELIVIDDCATDNTYAIVEEMAATDKRIQLYRNEKNLGVADTRNKGFELARGKYVALLDSDDIWRKDKLEKQIVLAEKWNPCLVYSSYALVDENGNSKKRDYVVPEYTDFKTMLIENVIGCSTVMISKEIIDKYHFQKEFYHEDYVYWIQAIQAGYKAVGISDVLVDYRVMNESRSGNKIRSAKKRWHIYRKFLNMSFVSSSYAWIRYVINGLIKYAR